MSDSQFLYQKLDTLSEMDMLDKSIPLDISNNLNNKFILREYQKEAFARFSYYTNDYKGRKLPIHLLYNMATGCGKTNIMAGLILSLYKKGYRNFLFFVNSNNIIKKTKENFLNNNASKYLFNDKIVFDGKQISIKEVTNFSSTTDEDINIKFTTIQGLHSDLTVVKENNISYEDFEDTKIVILSDEAHHINATTKGGKPTKSEEEERVSWENTVMHILNSHNENILLEFTATIDLSNEFIAKKYLDKIIYKYDLKQFRLEGYSKEVDIMKADMEQNDRILQALILSQYRLMIAEDNKIFCKPVILFKAQKTVVESEENLKNFNLLIKELKSEQVDKIRSKSDTGVMKKAFEFFDKINISSEDLVRELKEDFAPKYCISANDDSEAGKNQILLNTLEDKTNRIRAVFAVQKLNEGWDVLNLFDIVRLYEGRDGDWKKNGEYQAGKTTMSEAQLIGRGARYFPFVSDRAFGEDKYRRKFDNKDDDLRVLETFYYHTSFDSKYISEITSALIQVGMIEDVERKRDFNLQFKNSFKNSKFFKEGIVFTNERREKSYANVDSLKKIGLTTKSFNYTSLFTGKSDDIEAFDIKKTDNQVKLEKEPRSIYIKDMDERTVRKAIQRNDFYTFDTLKKYFGKLESINEFISSDNFLGDIQIHFFSTKEILDNLSETNKLNAISSLLSQLEGEIKDKKIEYEGTPIFKSKNLNLIAFEKPLKIEQNAELFSKDKDWFVFNEINVTSEERNFLNMFEIKIQELEKKYTDIYLIRNERVVIIYSFKTGDRFEPDFLLFMKSKDTKEPFIYQIFVEPKGNQFKDSNGRFEDSAEGWKQEFLLEIDKGAEILEMNFGNYKLVGLPFYNEDLKDEFEKAMNVQFK